MPLYLLSKNILLGLALSSLLSSCGDGVTDPSEQIDVTVISGDGQLADVGGTLPQDLLVRSSDADGNAVGNVDLLFSVVQGGPRRFLPNYEMGGMLTMKKLTDDVEQTRSM